MDDENFEIVIDDDNFESNWDILIPTIAQEIEQWNI
jgi:hypothetical protein